MDAKDKIENLIHKLLAMVVQAKEEHSMGGWALMTPTSDEFQMYTYICATFEAFGYHNLAQLCTLDKSEASLETEIGYYTRARVLYNLAGDKAIDRIRAESGGDEGRNFKVLKKITSPHWKVLGRMPKEQYYLVIIMQ